MNNIKQQLIAWKNSLLKPNKNDVLLQVIEGKNAFDISAVFTEEKVFEITENTLTKRLFKQHNDHVKETASPIFGIVQDYLKFSLAGMDYQMPFLIASASIQKNRLSQQFQVEQTEDFVMNPLLLTTLDMEQLPENREEVAIFLKEKGLEVEFFNGCWVANIHPHRFVLQKEFDELLNVDKLSAPLNSLFGNDFKQEKLALAPYFLFSADESQRIAIASVENENCVIQGPPGTGKSQVIANLIGKNLGNGNNTLLVAEKTVALQVIYDQLREKELHHFCALYHHELKSKNFIGALRKAWDVLEKMPREHVVVSEQSNFLKQGLNLSLDRLKQEDLIGGLSFSEFFKKYEKVEKTERFSLAPPSLIEWEKDKKILLDLERNGMPLFGAWNKLKTDKNTIQDSAKQLEKAIFLLENNNLLELGLSDLKEQLLATHLVDLFYYNDLALPIAVFQNDSKIQKQFLKHYNALQTLSEKEELLKIEEQNWSKKFSLSELNEYMLALSSLNKFNIRSQLTKRKLSKFTDLNLGNGKQAIENLIALNKVRHEIIAVKEKLRKLNLPEEIAIYEHILYVISKINSTDESQTKRLFEISQEERNVLKAQSAVLVELHTLLTPHFQLNEKDSLIQQLKEIQVALPSMIGHSSQLKQIHSSTKRVLLISENLAEAEAIIYHSHYLNFKGLFPELAQLTGKDIQEKIENILSAEQQENTASARFIQQKIKAKFEEAQQLLQTPARQLTAAEKQQKVRLRKGKSILVKAFDRKRIFPSVRELLESEAREWIAILQPVFLCSPYSVAKSFPIDYPFDLVIFDEASQIPLSHIVGSVQRAKRVVISGDQQQMAPQFYFQRKDAQESDALHHASFYWKNAFLTNHYRSLFPELIAFSNQYFYENKLKTFPFPIARNAIEIVEANGQFIDRKNEEEAKIAAELVTEKIKNQEFNFGLVAFSQTQLEAILDKIPPHLIAKAEESTSVFFQSLENVQGDQCEHLIISLGYAKNEDGEFHKRFGPLNQEQGHRRLNVLMSRAIRKITFIRSVTAEDFSISTNEGVEMLRKLMLFLENKENHNQKQTLPQGIEIEDNKLTILQPAQFFTNAQELCDYYATAKKRNWEVTVAL